MGVTRERAQRRVEQTWCPRCLASDVSPPDSCAKPPGDEPLEGKEQGMGQHLCSLCAQSGLRSPLLLPFPPIQFFRASSLPPKDPIRRATYTPICPQFQLLTSPLWSLLQGCASPAMDLIEKLVLMSNDLFQEAFEDCQSLFDGKNVKQHVQLLFLVTILSSRHFSGSSHSTDTRSRNDHPLQEYGVRPDLAPSRRGLPV